MEKVEEIYNDAIEALQMSGNQLDFDEWAPAWLIDENGNLIDDEEKKKNLRAIWDRALQEVNKK